MSTGAVDLSACAREPIHIPGAIQPHGVLFALAAEDAGTIRMASDNVAGRLGGPPAEALVGGPLEAALGPAAGEVLAALTGGDGDTAGPLRLDLGVAGWWDAILHRSPSGPVLELEPAAAEEPRSVAGLYGRVRSALARLQGARDLPSLQDVMADVIADLTGMHKVMVYRFDREWNGEVVAERSDGGALPSYLGLRFPASDIPAQARELYRRSWLRLIADVDYEPALLVPARHPDTGAPLDLSGATLRSVSPVHLEYLRTMGVAASMSVSLLAGERLWGLVACHHAAPLHLPYAQRTACEFLARTFSIQLSALTGDREVEYALELERVQARVVERLAGRPDWMDALGSGEPRLDEAVGADGAALRFRDAWAISGRVPEPDQLEALVAWLDQADESPLVTDRLPERFPAARAFAPVAGGLLAVRVSPQPADWILWFRREQVETVHWAGDPRKPATRDPESSVGATGDGTPLPRLHPRRSFETWAETVRGRSRPWTPAEVEAARAFRLRLVDVILRQAEAVGRLNDELRRSNEELEAFAYMAGHDLKEPLRGVRTYVEILEDQRPEPENPGPRGAASPLSEIVRLSDRMEGMLDSLLRYARAQHLALDLAPVDLQALVEDVLHVLRPRLDAAGTRVEIPTPLPTVVCDEVRAASVFQNLISNAIKFNDDDGPWLGITWSGGGDEPVVVRIADNGIGIAPEHRDRVFQLFRRLHGERAYGGGSGAGLTIARRLIERHGGRTWIEPSEQGGTAFHFTLENARG